MNFTLYDFDKNQKLIDYSLSVAQNFDFNEG